ncbi:hypothetical protein [Burkholderia sp. THE68]|uniref:hypothetical protein n=1 Tax=Burkholderia sp. THE68 TaxID=758782 RepID=UPI0013894683|nr:hypothetical protein [Burkholderia sp. THE68]
MARCPGLRCDALDGAFYTFANCSGAIGAATLSSDVIATNLDFANYLLEAAYVGVAYGSAFGVETMCGSRMLFRCPRRATRAGASRQRVRR